MLTFLKFMEGKSWLTVSCETPWYRWAFTGNEMPEQEWGKSRRKQKNQK